jgi:hypothetical protein
MPLAACGPHNANNGASGPTTMISDAPGSEASAGVETESGTPSDSPPASDGGCGVRQAPRTFVGFADKQGLDAFERTAAEAERLLAAIKIELCSLRAAQDHDGTLRAALSGGLIEITAVRFTRGDLSTANVDVQTLASDGRSAGAEIHWLVRTKRSAQGWQVVSSARR